MKWLVTYPENAPAVANYVGWMRTQGVEADLVSADFARPPDTVSHDALLLSGGGDVDPALYGDAGRHPETGDVAAARDRLELDLIGEFLGTGRPVFGICRGIQILNVAFGGRLIQHVPDFLAGRGEESHRKEGEGDAVHPIRIERSSRLGSTLRGVGQVNSSHHQAVHPQAVGRGLRVTALSGAGVIEALESFEHGAPMLAVQWHPERMERSDPASAALLRLMIDLVRPT
jgi:putative glutamine amidotransferase